MVCFINALRLVGKLSDIFKKLKKNRFDKNIQLAVKGETKKFKTLAKILKWILIIACVYWIIMFVIMFIVFSGAAHK